MVSPINTQGAVPATQATTTNNPTTLKVILLAATIIGLGLSAITGSLILLGISIVLLAGFLFNDCSGSTPPIFQPVYNVIPAPIFSNFVYPAAQRVGPIPRASYLGARHPVPPPSVAAQGTPTVPSRPRHAITPQRHRVGP